MTYKLFIDDERWPPAPADPHADEWQIARSSIAAIDMIEMMGIPAFISFDHDLGGDDTSMQFIWWFIEYCMDLQERGETFTFPAFDVHSQNPVGAANIRALMNSFTNFLKEQQ